MTEEQVRQMLHERCEASSQASVADAAGVAACYFSQMMTGTRPISKRVLDYLGLVKEPVSYRVKSACTKANNPPC